MKVKLLSPPLRSDAKDLLHAEWRCCGLNLRTTWVGCDGRRRTVDSSSLLADQDKSDFGTLGLVLNSTRDSGGIFCTESRQLKSADVYARACRVTDGNFIIINCSRGGAILAESGPMGKGRQPERPPNTIARHCSFDGNVAAIAVNLNASTTPFTVT
jgi:hypothetical protein